MRFRLAGRPPEGSAQAGSDRARGIRLDRADMPYDTEGESVMVILNVVEWVIPGVREQ